jgi:23S rRNA (adenine2503-C2)-methyltransferase
MINLHTIPQNELELILKSWGYPKYRAEQIWKWVREQGVESIDEMNNIPKKLRNDLKQHATLTSLVLDCELVSKDGTRKRVYKLSGK